MEGKLLLVPVSLALVAGALAGCLGQADTDLGLDGLVDLDAILAKAIVADHDHADPALHDQSYNMEVLAYHAGLDEPTVYGEVDVRGGLAAMAVLATTGDERSGFVLFDAMRPDDLTPLGRWIAPVPTVYAADVKLSDDGRWAFLATQRTGVLPFAVLEERGQSLPAEAPADVYSPNGVADVGLYVVDVSNPTSPQTRLFFPDQTNGIHMLDVHTVNGRTFLFLQASTGYPSCPLTVKQVNQQVCLPEEAPKPPGAGIRIDVAEFTVGGAGPQVRVVQTYQATTGHYIHDMTVVDDPLLEKTVMYVAHWDDGIHMVDVSALPGTMTLLGKWNPDAFRDDPDLLGHVHTVWGEVLDIGGEERRIVVGSPEFGFRPGAPPYWIVDATDEANPVELGTWSLPGADDLLFIEGMEPMPLYRWSTHNIVLEHGLLYLSHFHGGVWVFDLTQDPANPTVIGYTMLAPQARGPGAFGGAIDDSPSVWDAVPYMGTLWISDINGGLYTASLVEKPEHVMDEMEAGHAH